MKRNRARIAESQYQSGYRVWGPREAKKEGKPVLRSSILEITQGSEEDKREGLP